MSKIENALQQLFDKHRIVFWYDEKCELRDEFEHVILSEVEKLEIDNNEFTVKYRVLVESPEQRFLLYHEGPHPEGIDNWLLDLEFAHGRFRADQTALWMAELDLGPSFQNLVQEHNEFFHAASRRQALINQKQDNDDHDTLRFKMMAVCLSPETEPRLSSILFELINEFADGEDKKIGFLEKYGLLDYFWKDIRAIYGYHPDQPHIKDFVLSLFQSSFQQGLHLTSDLTNEATVFIRHWQDSNKYRQAFSQLSEEFSELLEIPHQLEAYHYKELLEMDLFRVIDQRILAQLQQDVINRTISITECQKIINRRSVTFWFESHYKYLYQAVQNASNLFAQLSEHHYHIGSFEDGIHKYTTSWYRIDQTYRNYIFAMRQANQPNFFQDLNEQVENHYVNNFLLPVNNNWQAIIDSMEFWNVTSFPQQQHFFETTVTDILTSGAKVAIIISDAMRYEIGAELTERIEGAGKLSATLSTAIAALPTYTQLGMAALLPNQRLEIQDNGNVFVDGLSSAGLDNRRKILSKHFPEASDVMSANELRGMSASDRRTLFTKNKVLCVYHNQIDAVGDSQDEDRTFDAVETTIVELIELVKMLRNANYAKILLTADHGFLYQYQPLDESDFAQTEVSYEKIYSQSRRYVVGEGLSSSSNLKKFSASEVGLEGKYQLLMAKSVNRLRRKGAGSRFVHGGSSLQEVTLPVILVSKERTTTSIVREVEVDRIQQSSDRITTGQISVVFYQTEPVSQKVRPRKVRAAFYTSDGLLISDTQLIHFESDSDNARDREITRRFLFNHEAQNHKNEVVYLRLEEQILNTQHYVLYKSWQYTLSLGGFGALFEDF